MQSNAIAMFCECQGNGHEDGCTLHLWLLIKYGIPKLKVDGIGNIAGCHACLSAQELADCDRWFARLSPIWIAEKRQTLTVEECGWVQEYHERNKQYGCE